MKTSTWLILNQVAALAAWGIPLSDSPGLVPPDTYKGVSFAPVTSLHSVQSQN